MAAAQPAPVPEPEPEPEAAPEPEPALAPAAAALDLHGLPTARGRPVVGIDRRREPDAGGAALADARPVALSERDLTIAFPPGANFLRRLAEQDDHRRMATQAWRTISGHALSAALRAPGKSDEAEPAGSPTLSGEELVKRFIEEFDAEEIVAEELLDDEPDEREAH